MQRLRLHALRGGHGALFIGVTLFLPRGIIGTLNYWRETRAEKKSAMAADALPQPAE